VYGYGKVKLGLVAYDILSYDKSLENHKSFSCEELKEIEPHIRTKHCQGGFVYCDCQVTYPERLCLENILLAKAAGAEVHNYAEVTQLIQDGRTVRGVRVRHTLTGEEDEIHASLVVNAAGPWVDQVLNRKYTPSERRMGGTKGSHLLLPRFEGGPRHAIYVPAHQDGRPFFIIPWRDYYWVGTTDIRYNGDLDHVHITKEEIDYLLTEVNFVFPMAQMTPEDIIYCLSGIRPLPKTEDETEEAEITRRHIIFDHDREELEGLLSIIGGKLTTYRNLAEETVDYIFHKFHKERPHCRTREEPLWGGGMKDINRYVQDNSRRFSRPGELSPEQVAYLISVYGTRFKDVLRLTEQEPALRQRICPNNPDIKAQIVFSVQNELPQTLADIYLRRTGIGTSACKGLDCAREGAKLMGKLLGWRRKRVKQEVEEYKKVVQELYRCSPGA
ncbi:MAG: glycerol-3-phosphate dehydrogenase/oxidase, partial [Calditrichaeota bacterium]